MSYRPETLETPPCPLCGSTQSARTGLGDGLFSVARCSGCGVLFLSPRVREEEMAARYRRGAYFEGGDVGYSSYPEQEKSLRLTFRRLLKTLKKEGLTGGSVLEIGCGHGFFLDEAEAYFRQRVGTDLSEAAASKASARADRIYVGGTEVLPDGVRFDLVVALHVVEHVYDPHGFTQALASFVKPGGHLLMATPDAGSLWFRWLGNRWPSFKFPEHVVFLDEQGLGRLFRAAGLKNTIEVPYPHAFPVAEVLRKVGVSLGGRIGQVSLWIPGTTLALAGKVDGGLIE